MGSCYHLASNVIGPDAGQWWQQYFLRTSLYNRGFSTLYAVPPRNQSSRYQVLSTDISTGSPLQELPTITRRKPFLQHYSHFQGHPLYNIVDQCKTIKGHATGKGPSPLLSYWSNCLRLLWCITTQLLALLKICFLSFIYMLILKVLQLMYCMLIFRSSWVTWPATAGYFPVLFLIV